MSDNEEIEVEASGYAVLPKEVTDEIGSIKLFNKWSYEDVEIRDISLTLEIPQPTGFCSAREVRKANMLQAITFKSAALSTFPILLADMPSSVSARPSAQSSSVSPTLS
jgi:hypothetical protein